jgi:hypothetical protein
MKAVAIVLPRFSWNLWIDLARTLRPVAVSSFRKTDSENKINFIKQSELTQLRESANPDPSGLDHKSLGRKMIYALRKDVHKEFQESKLEMLDLQIEALETIIEKLKKQRDGLSGEGLTVLELNQKTIDQARQNLKRKEEKSLRKVKGLRGTRKLA